MKVLSEAYVAYNISVEKVDQLVGNIAASNMILMMRSRREDMEARRLYNYH